MSRSHRIVLAIGALHGIAGGAERVLVDVANGLHERGHDVTVMTYEDVNGPSYYPLASGIRQVNARTRPSRTARRAARGAPTRPIHAAASPAPPPTSPLSPREIARWSGRHLPRIRRFRRVLRSLGPDVVIGFMPSTFPYLTIAARSLRVPSIASLHNVPSRDLGHDPLRWDQSPTDIWIRRWSLRRADVVTVLLPSFVAELDPVVQATTLVIPNMIRPVGAERADPTFSPDSPNTVLAVGKLVEAKGHRTLIDAWAELEAETPGWRVEIVGDGPLRAELAEQIRSLGLRRVEITPPTTAILDRYRASRLLAMPSIHEGFGLVTGEALACGLPVIGFADCAGTNELVRDGENGVLVDPGCDRAKALAAALADLIADEDRRVAMGAAGPATVAELSVERTIDLWEHAVEKAMRSTTA